MWSVAQTKLPRNLGLKLAFLYEGQPVTFADVMRGWIEDDEFRTLFNATLAAVPYTAFRWETPRATRTTLKQPFECVVLDSPDLDRPFDRAAFAEHFSAEACVVTFPNLRGDAWLVVPCPLHPEAAYAHLAAFVRNAPADEQFALWQQVGEALENRLGTKPVWLSTAGAGVPWLHVRLDDVPKYYRYDPYRA